MASLETSKRSATVVLLASLAGPKIDGTTQAVQATIPFAFDTQRHIIVLRDHKQPSRESPRTVDMEVSIEQSGFPNFSFVAVPDRIDSSGHTLLKNVGKQTEYTGPQLSVAEVKAAIADRQHRQSSPPIIIYAQDSPSFENPQPVVVQTVEEGYRGAANRAAYVKERNSLQPHPIPYDYVVGIENAQFRSRISGTPPKEVVTDTAFVYVENWEGDWAAAHSAGVALGPNHGVTFFEQSRATGFNKPAGHIFDPENPQDPHGKATGGLFTRADLLATPITVALQQLEAQRRTK